MMQAPVAGPLLVAVAVILLPTAGIGHRFGLWRFRQGVALVIVAGALAALGAGLCLVALPGLSSQELAPLWATIVGAVVGLAVLSVPLRRLVLHVRLPRMHDVSTDLDDPPRFVSLLEQRADVPEHVQQGEPLAERQRRAYPEIQPLELDLPVDAAFATVLAAADELGWHVVAQDPAAGRLEATATSLWFGFKNDVVVRVREHEGVSRVDVRSASRVGEGDLGTNAARIRAFLTLVSGGG